MGMAVVGSSLLGVAVVYLVTGDATTVLGFSFGASSLAMFAKAGGAYSPRLPTSAPTLSEVELGIPEDDPRNPAVIADNVVTTSVTSPEWALTCSTPTSLQWRRRSSCRFSR